MNIYQTIMKAHYVATEAQVEQLAAAAHGVSQELETHNLTYLRIELVGAQAVLGAKKRGRMPAADSQLAVLDKVNSKFYGAVLRGITTPDIAQDDGLEPMERSRRALERNRRSTFARSSHATLVAFVRGGGDLRAVDPETATKSSLRAAVSAPEPTDKVERQLQRAQGTILRAVARQARADPAKATRLLEGLIAALQERLESISMEGPAKHEAAPVAAGRAPPGDRGHMRTRVGVPQFHRGTQ